MNSYLTGEGNRQRWLFPFVSVYIFLPIIDYFYMYKKRLQMITYSRGHFVNLIVQQKQTIMTHNEELTERLTEELTERLTESLNSNCHQ